MSKLHEYARRMGVETHSIEVIKGGWDQEVPRPDLEIAHDLLAKLPKRISNGLIYRWGFWYPKGQYEKADDDGVNFIEAVIALCERSKP